MKRFSPPMTMLMVTMGCALFAAGPVVADGDGFVETWIRYAEDDFLTSEIRVDYEYKSTIGEAQEEAAEDDFFSDFGAETKDKQPEFRARVFGWVDPSGFEDDATAEIYTGGITFYPSTDVSIFVGKDYEIWGKADKINPVDVLNAEDFTQFLVQPKERRKLSNYVLNIIHAAGDDKLQFVYNPFYVENEIASLDSPWCDTRCSFAQPRLVPPFTSVIVNDDVSGRRDVEDSEYALRYSSRVERVDYSLVLHNGFDRFPIWSRQFSSPTDVEFTRELKRRWRFGGDLSFTLGSFGVRTEILFQPDSVQQFDPESAEFIADDDGLDDVDQINWVVGVDWTTDSDVYMNIQYAENSLLDDGDYFRTTFEELGTLQVSKTFLNDDLKLLLNVFYEFSDDSYSLDPEVVYTVNSDLNWTTGVWLFRGDDDSFFGEQEINDHIYTHLKYLF